MNSSELKGYLTGLILGDGFIDNGVSKRAFRIKSINKDFVDKIKLDIDSSTKFETIIKSFDSRTGKDGTNHKKYYELTIKPQPYFSKIYHYFYNDYRERIISKKSLESLTWNGWANWFVSDGYICKVGKESGKITDRRVDLCTDRYSKADINYLANFIREKYGFSIKVFERGSVSRVRFHLETAQDFLYNISPFVVPSFNYKLNMEYNYRPKWMNDNYYELMTNIQSASLQKISLDEEMI